MDPMTLTNVLSFLRPDIESTIVIGEGAADVARIVMAAMDGQARAFVLRADVDEIPPEENTGSEDPMEPTVIDAGYLSLAPEQFPPGDFPSVVVCVGRQTPLIEREQICTSAYQWLRSFGDDCRIFIELQWEDTDQWDWSKMALAYACRLQDIGLGITEINGLPYTTDGMVNLSDIAVQVAKLERFIQQLLACDSPILEYDASLLTIRAQKFRSQLAELQSSSLQRHGDEDTPESLDVAYAKDFIATKVQLPRIFATLAANVDEPPSATSTAEQNPQRPAR